LHGRGRLVYSDRVEFNGVFERGQMKKGKLVYEKDKIWFDGTFEDN